MLPIVIVVQKGRKVRAGLDPGISNWDPKIKVEICVSVTIVHSPSIIYIFVYPKILLTNM